MPDRGPAALVVHTRRGVVPIPSTGDERTDALLERICRRAGFPVTTAAGELRAAERRESRGESRGVPDRRGGLVGLRHRLEDNELPDLVSDSVSAATP